MPAPLITPIAYRDPLAAFAPLAPEPMAVLLDSALATDQGRFSYIAAAPFRTLRATPHPWRVSIAGKAVADDPFTAVAQALKAFAVADVTLPVPFGGGAIGFFAYELGGVLEDLPAPRGAMIDADMVVGIYDTIAAFDHEARAAWIIAWGFDGDAALNTARLTERLGESLPPETLVPQTSWHQETPRAAYEAMVAATVALIHAGDIFQANITQRFIAETPPDLDWFTLYRRLREETRAPFAAFFNAGEGIHLLSASPERFLTVDRHGKVETRPIKGTRPRGADAAEDKKLADALLASAKDRAENLMIVDLLRNDLARVCVPGSIAVPVLNGLESFPAVHHLVSVVTGQLRTDTTAMDLLRACFPGGSITGAPKIRAMQIIHELEQGPRGPYCGTLVWLGFDGAMDSSIVIRSLVGDEKRLYAQAGGGIVAESDPALEYEESLLKVAPLLAALTETAPQ